MTDTAGADPGSAGDERTTDGRPAATRRGFLAAGGAGVTAAVAGCLGGDDDTLTVSTWSGANLEVFEETIKPMYEDETGNDLEVEGNWENILGQIRQSPSDDPPFDLTVGSNRDHVLGAQDDLWEPIRTENVPNLDGVKPTLRDNLDSDDGVPVAYGVMGYAYDEDIGFDLDSWADLREDPDIDLALPGAYFFNTVLMGALAHDETSRDAELFDEDGRDAIFDTLREMPIETFYQGAEDLWQSMSGGTADVGQYFYAYSLRRDEQSEMDIGFHVPDLTLGYVDHYQVARGSSNREAAEEFINFLLDPDTQTAYAEEFNLGMAHEDASHPERTRAEVPIADGDLDENVVFKDFSEVAEAAPDLNERFSEFQQEF